MLLTYQYNVMYLFYFYEKNIIQELENKRMFLFNKRRRLQKLRQKTMAGKSPLKIPPVGNAPNIVHYRSLNRMLSCKASKPFRGRRSR